jgi:hypothetical protein
VAAASRLTRRRRTPSDLPVFRPENADAIGQGLWHLTPSIIGAAGKIKRLAKMGAKPHIGPGTVLGNVFVNAAMAERPATESLPLLAQAADGLKTSIERNFLAGTCSRQQRRSGPQSSQEEDAA